MPARPIRVAVVSDDPLVRSALADALAARDELDVVGDPAEADVCLLDPGAAGPGDWVEELGRLASPAIVLLAEDAQARAALSAGARGAVRRDARAARLAAAVAAVEQGLTVVDGELGEAFVPRAPAVAPVETLTAREGEVLELMALGLSNRHIAERLGISDHTAKFHVNSILAKLGAASRTEAVVLAARRGLVMI
jgi:DNA-binding NarL/FixJ family response regulator